ncbi:MAG: hypothetical protein RSC80_08110 [Odoribacter sp.]
MIDVQVRIHDRFSVEFKIGYLVKKNLPVNDFMMNTWIFIPNSLDINPSTYTKNQFYNDVKSNIRLITPIYELDEMTDGKALPFIFLQGILRELEVEPTREHLTDYEYQIKMFCSITKSALRRETDRITNNIPNDEIKHTIARFIENITQINNRYREQCSFIKTANLPHEAEIYFAFGDEFLVNQLEYYIYRLLESLKNRYLSDYTQMEEMLMQLVKDGIAYKTTRGYQLVKKNSVDRNRSVVFRMRLLAKYAESHLFLDASKKKDGLMAEQVYYSAAAGISMIFATAIAFSFQQKYGNFTMPLFVALVVSYMLKDRIKELMRYYFVHRLAKKYFDNKTTISIKETLLGWIKEGIDFITDERVPEAIMEMRNRSDLLEADNRNTKEKIILYRKLVRIDGTALDESNQYDVSGVNDIVRFNVFSFIHKMDNPEVSLAVPAENGGYEMTEGERIYYINFLIQLRYDDNIDYKRYRLLVSRNGIEGIEKMQE